MTAPAHSPPADAQSIRLDATDADVESPAEVAAQLPHARTRAAGSALIVSATASQKRGALGRFLGDGKVKVPLASRCTALLARGYVDLSASGEAAWGVVPADPASDEG